MKIIYVPLRFRKAGRVWCGGARETHWATCHNGLTPSKTKEFFKSSRFLNLNGTIITAVSHTVCRILFHNFYSLISDPLGTVVCESLDPLTNDPPFECNCKEGS